MCHRAVECHFVMDEEGAVCAILAEIGMEGEIAIFEMAGVVIVWRTF